MSSALRFLELSLELLALVLGEEDVRGVEGVELDPEEVDEVPVDWLDKF